MIVSLACPLGDVKKDYVMRYTVVSTHPASHASGPPIPKPQARSPEPLNPQERLGLGSAIFSFISANFGASILFSDRVLRQVLGLEFGVRR